MNPSNTNDTILAITTLYADYNNNKITLGELHDGVLDLIQQEVIKARIDGAKDYNRMLTNELGKTEYTAIGLDGIVGVYRQEIVGSAIRKANYFLIQLQNQIGEK